MTGRHRAARILCCVAVLAPALAACGPRGMEAMDVLADLGAGWGPSALKDATPTPVRRAVGYPGGSGDLYEPGAPEAPRAALVLVPGAAPAGKDDPRLVAFAMTFARAGFAVLVPEIPNLRELKVRPADTDRIAAAALHMAGRAEESDLASVGLAAISYAVGPALLAVLRPEVRGRVDFVLGIGGYYGMASVITFFTTGRFRERPGEPWRHLAPNAYGKWVFVLANADRIESARDRVNLRAMAQRRMQRLDADIADLVADLGPEGRAVYAVLANSEPERVPGLISALPRALREDMRALDLEARSLEGLEARLILVHGRDDAIIPYTESLRLARAAPAGLAELFIVDSLAHVDLGPLGLGDTLTLWRAILRVLEERDRAAPGDS